MTKKIIAFIITIALLLTSLPDILVLAKNDNKNKMPKTGEYLIKYKADVMIDDSADMQVLGEKHDFNSHVENKFKKHFPKDAKIKIKDELKHDKKGRKTQLMSIESEEDTDEVLKKLRTMEGVEYVEPNYKIDKFDDNDPDYSKQWGLHSSESYGIDISRVDYRDCDRITVAVLDTGIDISHPDLVQNIVPGWNFTEYEDETNNGNNVVYEDAETDKHGTHIAGIIAGAKNGIGIEGIAKKINIMPLKILDDDGGTVFHAIKAIEYAEENGAQIANCSWGNNHNSQFLYDAIKQSNMLFVCAAGNDGDNFSEVKTYPAAYDLDNIISVAAMNRNGEISEFSNYGEGVDIAAPGEDIYSTLPEGKYGYMSGTSMAAPFVTGVAALVKSEALDSSPAKIKKYITKGGIEVAEFNGKVDCGSYLNAFYPVYGTRYFDSNMPGGRYGTEYATVNGDIYGVGGYGYSGFINTILYYGFANPGWREDASIPYAVAKMSLAQYNNKLYIMGGLNESILNKVQIFDTDTKEFTYGTDMPAALYGAAFTTIDNKAYIFGGIDESGYSNKVYVYDMSDDKWEVKADLPFSFAYGRAVTIKNEIYILGGTDGDKCLDGIYKYNMEDGSINLETRMNIARKDFGATVYDNDIYIFDGSITANALENNLIHGSSETNDIIADMAIDSVERYDPESGICEETCCSGRTCIGMMALTCFDKIYIIGGWNGEYTADAYEFHGVNYPKSIQLKTSDDGETVKVMWDNVAYSHYYIEICGEEFYVNTHEYEFSVSDYAHEPCIPIRVRSYGGLYEAQYSVWSDTVYYTANSTMFDAKDVSFDFSDEDYIAGTAQSKWYKFSTGKAGAVNLYMDKVPEGCNYIVQLRNSSGEVLVESENSIYDYVITEYNYYITVTSTSGGSVNDSYILRGTFEASAESANLPDRIKPFLSPGSSDDDISTANMKDLSEYEGDDVPDGSEEVGLSENSVKAGGGGRSSNNVISELESISSYNTASSALNTFSTTEVTQSSSALSEEGDYANGSVTISSYTPSTNDKRLKLAIVVVPENEDDEISIKWTGSNTNYENFCWHWQDNPNRYYLTAILAKKSTSRTYNYKITYETKSDGSNGNYTVYTYKIIDSTSNEDFSSSTGNDLASCGNTISVLTNAETTVSGKIDHQCDKDFYKVTVSPNQKLTVVLKFPEGTEYSVDILDHKGTSNDYDAEQYMGGWIREDENLAWSAVQTDSTSRTYLILVRGEDDNYSDSPYNLTVLRHNLSDLESFEVNDDFEDADFQKTDFADDYLGTTYKSAVPIEFCIDSPVDDDLYAIDLNAGDKISMHMELPEEYNDSLHQYRLGVCSDVYYYGSGVEWKQHTYNNPNSMYSKSATFVADNTGTYYVVVSSIAREYDYAVKGSLVITKTSSEYLDENEIKERRYTNDFIYTSLLEINNVKIGVWGDTSITDYAYGNIDNELDVDWYSYTNRDGSNKSIVIYLSGGFSSDAGYRYVVLDSEYKVISGDANTICNIALNETYYIGVYVEEGKYHSNFTRDYSINVEQCLDTSFMELDNQYFGCKEFYFTEGEEKTIYFNKIIPANKLVTVSCIKSYINNDKLKIPSETLEGVIADVSLIDSSGNVRGYKQGGWHIPANYYYFQTGGMNDEQSYFEYNAHAMKIKVDVECNFYIGVYVTDYINDSEGFSHMDATGENAGQPNNYLIFNGAEHLNSEYHLADKYNYIAKMPVSGNANIYWEHLNKLGVTKKYGLLLYNPNDSTVNVTLNQKSGYSTANVPVDKLAPLYIWEDYENNRFSPDLLGSLTRDNNMLSIAPNASEWIYLDDISGTSDANGILFNGIINLSISDGKTLDCYAFMFSDNVQVRLENDFNLYNRQGTSAGMNFYGQADLGQHISGTTDAPFLRSQTIDMSKKENYKLLLTGYAAPYINYGEQAGLIYDGEPVKEHDLGLNSTNYSVIYNLNIINFSGSKMVLEYNPYTNPGYFCDIENGLYAVAKANDGELNTKLLIPKESTVMDVELKKGDNNIYLLVSGMSALTLTVRFE